MKRITHTIQGQTFYTYKPKIKLIAFKEVVFVGLACWTLWMVNQIIALSTIKTFIPIK